jgi:predicted DNA-binding transcriptional regulator YafY
MRADRLLSLLMLLQARGRMTAPRLARELEVSERTIYRDIDALSAAGVPIYSEAGPGGGYSLLDSYRTNLTGLTEGEVRALFMLNIPQPLADLGVGPELAAALRKLAAALPSSRRADEERVRRRFHLDAVGWDQVEESAPHLATVHQAVWHDRRLHLAYRIGPLSVHIEQTVDPYGLAAKAGVWHLVYAVNLEGGLRKGALRVQRVASLLDARLSAESFERPADFDLAAFWREWCAERDVSRARYVVTVRVAPGFVAELPVYFGDPVRQQIAEAGPPDAEGWLTLQLSFESLEAARARILGFGRGVEVLAPYALRRSILDYAEQIMALYAR